MRFIGIDLAWGERNRTGIAELDPSGGLLRSGSVTTDDEVAAFLGDLGPGVVAAIDAPLVVPNYTGQRPCERDLGRLFRAFDAGPYPANRGNPAFHPEPRGARLAQRFGWILGPDVRPAEGRSVAIEVYPHPAMVSLFRIPRVLPYKAKRQRDVASRKAAFRTLFAAMEITCRPLVLGESKRWRLLLEQVDGAARQVDLDTVEDEVDAIFCAYLAWLWANDPDELTVLGDHATGYIVTPLPPDTPSDRTHAIDMAAGQVRSGDANRGRAPASGNGNLDSTYRTEGGASGSVAERSPSTHGRRPAGSHDMVAPTGRCFCGCGRAAKPGRYFVATHDRRAEARVIAEQYGSIAAFIVAHGYGPDRADDAQPT